MHTYTDRHTHLAAVKALKEGAICPSAMLPITAQKNTVITPPPVGQSL